MGWGRGGNDPRYRAAMLRHRDRLALLDSIDDRADFVLEFADAYGCLLQSGHMIAQYGHRPKVDPYSARNWLRRLRQ